MEFGKTLRAAREARGKSVDELARETRLMSQLIIDLENENMSRIAAPIYGRGFVKLYCEALGLEAKPMIEAFMDVYNGNHAPIIRERETVNEPSSGTQDFLIEEEKPIPADDDTLKLEGETIESQTFSKPSISRYSTPLRENQYSNHGGIPPIVYRIGAVGLGAILAIWLLYKLIGGLVDLMSGDTSSKEQYSETTRIEETVKTPREPMKIPALYID